MKRLVRHSWPGNVRELENVIERAVALETTDTIMPDRLPDPLAHAGDPAGAAPQLGPGFTLDDHLNRIEKDLVEEALEKAGGDRTHACELLGITPRSLRYLIRKHALAGACGGDKKWLPRHLVACPKVSVGRSNPSFSTSYGRGRPGIVLAL